MTSEAWPKATTIGSWEGRGIAILFVLLGGPWAALLPFNGRPWPQWAIMAYLALVAIAAAGVLYWSFRLGVRFDDHGVTIRGIFQTDRYGWPEVSRFTDGCIRGGEGVRLWALNVVLAGGLIVTVKATARKKQASPKVLAAIRQIAERYQIPAELTGTAMTAEGLPANPGLYPDPGGAPGSRQWDGKQWSPILQAGSGAGGPDGMKAPAEMWSPLPGSEQQWHDAAARARRATIWLAVSLIATAAGAAGTVALSTDSTADANDVTLIAGGAALACLIAVIWAWEERKKFRKIDQAAKAVGFPAVGERTVGPRDDPGEGLVTAHQPFPAADPAARAAQVRCAECGAEIAETVQVCARCGAPVARQRSTPADTAAGGSVDLIPPEHRLAGQRTRPGSRRNVLVGAGLAVLTTVIVVIAVTNSPAPSASSASSRSSAPSRSSASGFLVTSEELKAGYCLTGSDLGLGTNGYWPDEFTVVPCTQQHIAEVFYAGNAWPQSQAYPGYNRLDSRADDRCDTAFAAYDGTTSDKSVFTYDYIDPDGKYNWVSGDRWLACIAYESTSQYPGGAPVDYSIKGSNQ